MPEFDNKIRIIDLICDLLKIEMPSCYTAGGHFGYLGKTNKGDNKYLRLFTIN